MSMMHCPCCGTNYDSDFEDHCPALDEHHTPTFDVGSVLSREPDGMGFYYGFANGDLRQINVKPAFVNETDLAIQWEVYVAGMLVGAQPTKAGAETFALLWLSNHPVGCAA